MFEELKNYVIVGDNNFWYSSLKQVTKQELKDEIESIKTQIAEGGFDLGTPTGLIVYETINNHSVSM